MNASDLMTPQPVTCSPSDSVQDAARMMGAHNVGSLPVVEGGDSARIVGIVTDRDITIGAVASGRFDASVGDVMTPNPRTVRESDDLATVSRIMTEAQVRRVPVVDARGSVVGMIAQADLALSDGAMSDKEVGKVVERISEPNRSGAASERA